jgi:hypothetical protein
MAMIFQPDNNAFNFLHTHWKNGHSTYLQSTQHTTLINIPGRALHTQHKTHGNDLTRSTSTISSTFPGILRERCVSRKGAFFDRAVRVGDRAPNN